MEETKRVLIQNIQEWLKIDNEMKLLRKEMKNRREQKKILTALLVDIMKKNQIDDVALKNEKLLYTKTKTKTPLSKKHLFASLSTYFDNDKDMAKKMDGKLQTNKKLKTKNFGQS